RAWSRQSKESPMTNILRVRLRRAIGLVAIGLILLRPAPAMAWFGWLDEWSGPGPFWGELYEIRIACFGEPIPTTTTLLTLAGRAFGSSENLLTRRSTASPNLVLQDTDLQQVQRQWQELINALSRADVRLYGNDDQEAQLKNLVAGITSVDGLRTAVANGQSLVASSINPINRKMATVIGSGVLASLCGPEETREFSLEVELDHWRTNRTRAEFAGGKPISMYTVMPSVTWNAFHGKKPDVLELGIGAGFYVFRSEGFDTFGGLVIQPKVDFHAPTSWSN